MINIEPGNVWTCVLYDKQGASPLKNILNSGLQVDVPGAKYTWAYKSRQWNGKACLWEDIVDGHNQHVGISIRTGLLPRLTKLLDKGKVPWQYGADRRNLPLNHQLNKTQVKLRDYQYDAVKAAFGHTQGNLGWWPRGVLEMATGSGKTNVAVAMYEMNPVPTFFLVHRKDLLIQAKERFEQYGHTVGVIGGGEFNPVAGLNIATLQTLKSIFEDTESTRAGSLAVMMLNCKQVFFDECHLMASSLEKGNEFVGVADKFDVPFRWGLTATPFMRTAYDNMLLESVTGHSLYRLTSKQLIDMGYLTSPKVIMKHVPDKMNITLDWKKGRANTAKTKHWRKVESQGIKNNEIRTNLILDEMEKGPYPILVLVKTVEQANYIQKMYVSRGHAIPQFLSGKDKAVTRREAVRDLRDGTTKLLIATTIFDEGVNIPELAKVILASGGKSAVKTIQRIGRALRKAPGKTEAVIIDFQDGHHKMLKKHADARMKIYEEQEFEIVMEKKV